MLEGIPISEEVLLLAGKILIFTQALKKLLARLPWVVKIIEKFTGVQDLSGWAAIVLTAVVATLAGFQQYAADGMVSWVEVKEIIVAALAAMGGFDLLKSVFRRDKD